MEPSFTLFRVRGIPIGVHWSWLLVFALIVWSLAAVLFPATYPGLDGGAYVAMAVVAALLLFASVLLHELGHALTALREGMHLEGITLWLFGGVARLGGFPAAPGPELRVAAAGPAVTVVLLALFAGLNFLGGQVGFPAAAQGVVDYLARINLIVLAFNLVPALPLDGGRLLRAWLWRRQESFTRATRTAARAGQAFGILLIAVGVLQFFGGAGLGGLWFVFIGWFLLQAAQAEATMATVRRALQGVHVRDVMQADPQVVTPEQTVASFLDEAARNRRFSTYPVVGPGGLAGTVSLRQAAAVPVDERGGRTVAEVMTGAGEVMTVTPEQELAEVLQVLSGRRRAVVVADGRVAGVLSATDVARVLEVETARGVPEEEPRRRRRGGGPLTWALVIAGLVIAGGLLYHPPYAVVAPGGTFDVSGDVRISGTSTTPVEGRYLATTVTLDQPNAFGALVAAVRPDRDLLSLSSVVPEGISPDEYTDRQRALYQESRQIAAAAAARAQGLPVQVRGSGAEILDVVPGSPAADDLRTGDVVVEVGGRDVGTADDLRRVLQSRPAGTDFTLTVVRDGQRREVQLTTRQLPRLAEGPVIGVIAGTRDFSVDLPFEVSFTERRNVGGPSAGLAYALAISDLLARQDYAGGRTIAVTGTIDLDGDVGPVGAVTEKAISAEQAGADVFLVPVAEVDQANDTGGLEVRGVDELSGALSALS